MTSKQVTQQPIQWHVTQLRTGTMYSVTPVTMVTGTRVPGRFLFAGGVLGTRRGGARTF